MKQAILLYESMRRVEFDAAEGQARMVWAVMQGWKRPVDIADAMTGLKQTGMIEEI